MRANMIQFELTADHLKLIRRMNVGWQGDERGAPEIDPKRPYGNSSVLEDIHEILTGEDIGLISSKRDRLTLEEEDKYAKLHRETEIALQIVLTSGQFVPGLYEAERYRQDWKLLPRA
jgi:hypothetical protein